MTQERIYHEEHKEHEGERHKEGRADIEMIGATIIDSGLKVHRTLGPGLLESAYEHCLVRELHVRGLSVARQVAVPILCDGATLDAGYRLDIVVNKAVIIKVKSVDSLTAIHRAQLITY